jgi:hypothetical protein
MPCKHCTHPSICDSHGCGNDQAKPTSPAKALDSERAARALLTEEVQRLRARVLELEAVHEDASGAVLQERERCAKLPALPPDLIEYLLHHLRRERGALDGFMSLGNEAVRAKRLDEWILCLDGPNVGAKLETTAPAKN